MSDSYNPKDCSPPGSSVHGDSPGKNTGVGSHSLLQGIFLIQVSSPCSLMSPALAAGIFTTSANTWKGHWGSFCTVITVSPFLLRGNWHVILCKFKVYNVVIFLPTLWPCHVIHRILVPQRGIKPRYPAMEAWGPSPGHFLQCDDLIQVNIYCEMWTTIKLVNTSITSHN